MNNTQQHQQQFPADYIGLVSKRFPCGSAAVRYHFGTWKQVVIATENNWIEIHWILIIRQLIEPLEGVHWPRSVSERFRCGSGTDPPTVVDGIGFRAVSRAVRERFQCGLGHLMIKGWWNAPGVTAWKWDKMAPDSLTTRGPTHTLHTHTHTHGFTHAHTHVWHQPQKNKFPLYFLFDFTKSLINFN